jgi:hypothetical protein
MCVPMSVHAICAHRAVKSFGALGVSSVTVYGVKMEKNPSANALQRAGGYSFNFAVRNCPCSSVPMVCAREHRPHWHANSAASLEGVKSATLYVWCCLHLTDLVRIQDGKTRQATDELHQRQSPYACRLLVCRLSGVLKVTTPLHS